MQHDAAAGRWWVEELPRLGRKRKRLRARPTPPDLANPRTFASGSILFREDSAPRRSGRAAVWLTVIMDTQPNQQDPIRPTSPVDGATSHLDTRRFWANHPPIVWWIMGGLGVLVVIGLTAAAVTFFAADETQGEPAPAQGAAARPGAGGSASAVAGQNVPTSLNVRAAAGAFDPSNMTIPRGGTATITADAACRLQIDGKTVAALAVGQSYVFQADRAGDYELACEDQPAKANITVP